VFERGRARDFYAHMDICLAHRDALTIRVTAQASKLLMFSRYGSDGKKTSF